MSDNSTSGDIVSLGKTNKSIQGKDLGALRLYWESMRVNGDVPRRSHIDPRGLEALLENALIAEKIAPGLARMRIAGQHLSDVMGMEVRGMPISAFIAPDHRDQLALALSELFERPAVVTLHLNAPGKLGQPEMSATMVLMPLRSDLGDISRALGCFVTRGSIGRTPRRFEITSIDIDRIDTNPSATRERPVQAGFADPDQPFEPERPALPGERSYLRLVK